MAVKHAFSSAIADGGDATLVRPSDWNAAHVIQDFVLSSDISPAELVANTNDWNPTSLSTASVIRVSTDASRNLTGLQGGADGRIILLCNVGSKDLVLMHDVTSTAANRFYCPASIDFTLSGNASALLLYDSTSSRWRVVDMIPSHQTASALLGADVSMVSADTYYDGPSVSLGAGKWYITAGISCTGSANTWFTAKLWDGTTVATSGFQGSPTSFRGASIALSTIVSLTTTATWKISAAASAVSTSTVAAAAPANSAGNNASFIYAARIG